MTESSQCHFFSSADSTKKADIIVRSSNFSIDHILNKAGSNGTQVQQSLERDLDALNCKNVNRMFVKSETSFTPILDWLHYTRYHPPRLPRPLKTGPVKRTLGRLPRIPFTPYQLSELENAYRNANYMSSEDANKLAIKLDLTCTRVKIWFQNRRARERRESREASQKSSSKSFQYETTKPCD